MNAVLEAKNSIVALDLLALLRKALIINGGAYGNRTRLCQLASLIKNHL